MMKLTALVALAAALTGSTQALTLEKRAVTTCAAAGKLTSCQTSQSVDPSSSATCCYNGALKSGGKENGLILMVQDWDTGYGPADSTGIHGLWGDYCGGASYPASCSSDSGIPTATGSHITSVIQNNDESTYNTMQTYWLNDDGSNEDLWSHEYGKAHGTCYSTLRSSCFSPPSGISAADYALLGFFQQTVKLFRALPTYSWLSDAGITPSNSASYSLSDVQDALYNNFGADVYVGCDANNNLNAFQYYYHVQGSLINGTYHPTDAVGGSNCGSTVYWPPKTT